MIITEAQMFDYIMCPVRYDLAYTKGVRLSGKPTVKSLLTRVSNYFYLHILEHKDVPSLNLLSRKYESFYKKDFQNLTDKEYTDGLFMLRNFYNWACDEQLIVIDSTMPYELAVMENCIKGTMSPISINKDGHFELLIVDFSVKCKTQYDIDSKIKYSLDMLAFNSNDNISDKNIMGIRYHHVKSNKNLISFRTKNDYSRLESAIAGVCLGISNNAMYPREGFMCNSCEYINLCRGWK